jgi:hypothetical protein
LSAIQAVLNRMRKSTSLLSRSTDGGSDATSSSPLFRCAIASVSARCLNARLPAFCQSGIAFCSYLASV